MRSGYCGGGKPPIGQDAIRFLAHIAATAVGKGRTTVQKILIAIIRAYRYLISPWLGNHCRFHPSCSHYALESLERHGAARGLWLALRRLLRCHPWHPGGYDPVPPTHRSRPASASKHG